MYIIIPHYYTIYNIKKSMLSLPLWEKKNI